jgi:D-alanine-D-alanine ligase
MGIDPGSVVWDERQLRERVALVLDRYQQPALAEAYLPGREFTVGYLGNRGGIADRRRPWLYDQHGYHLFPVLEVDCSQGITPGLYGVQSKSLEVGAAGAPRYLCPAPVNGALRRHLQELAVAAGEAIGALDVSRVDFRLDAQGQPYLLEINTLPGLNPGLSDLCIMAAAEGMSYETLITEILYLGAARFGLPFTVAKVPESQAFPRPQPADLQPTREPQPVRATQSTRRSCAG